MKIDFLLNHKHLIEEIAKLKFLEFSHLAPEKTLDDYIKGLREHCNDKQFPITYIVLENENFLGTFSLRACDLDSHKQFTPWMGSVLVPPEKRNQGIGAFLVKQAEEKSKTMGYDFLYLFTPNKADWYAKLGWNTVDLSTLKNTPITIMRKSLTAFPNFLCFRL